MAVLLYQGENIFRGELVVGETGQLVETVEGWGRVQQSLGGQDVAGAADHLQRLTIDTDVVLVGGRQGLLCSENTPPAPMSGERFLLKCYFYGTAILSSESMATLLYQGNQYCVESQVLGKPVIS